MSKIKLNNRLKNYKSILEFVEQWENLSKAYFWSPPTSASSRRYYEKVNSRKIKVKNNKYIIEDTIEVDCSCRNIYVNKELYINGEKKTLRTLKMALGAY